MLFAPNAIIRSKYVPHRFVIPRAWARKYRLYSSFRVAAFDQVFAGKIVFATSLARSNSTPSTRRGSNRNNGLSSTPAVAGNDARTLYAEPPLLISVLETRRHASNGD